MIITWAKQDQHNGTPLYDITLSILSEAKDQKIKQKIRSILCIYYLR